MVDQFDKSQVVVSEVEVRVVRAEERRRWDELMARHHYLGFRQFAGRGLRHVAVWRGHWLALLGWQAGAFKCAPRDRWLGWHRSVQFRRLHLIGNNTRFLMLPEAGAIRNLASRILGQSLRRLSDDWQGAYGHPLELAETNALLEDVAVEGCLITLDALHTTVDTEPVIVDSHRADYLFTVKGKPPETDALLKSLDWTAPTVRSDHTAPEKGHGRLEMRHLEALTLPPQWVRFKHARQAIRITRQRTHLNTGKTTTETVYALTSVPAERANPKQLLAWNRGHWAVEMNHYRRDVSLGEDARRSRARHAPANNATLNNLVLAIVFYRGFRRLPEAQRHFMMHRKEALDAILCPN